jgi:hypothetical protein
LMTSSNLVGCTTGRPPAAQIPIFNGAAQRLS